jgi:hypothetical protein
MKGHAMQRRFTIEYGGELSCHERSLLRLVSRVLRGYPSDYQMTALISLLATASAELVKTETEMERLIQQIGWQLRAARRADIKAKGLRR